MMSKRYQRAVSVTLIWKVSGERLILPVSVGKKLQPKPPVPVAAILWLEQRISGTFLALPKQSIWQSDLANPDVGGIFG
jgi:hypothetical protein